MRRILGRAAALALIAGLCATIPTAGATSRAHTAPALTLPAHADGLSRALASGRISPAKEALLRAQALFRPARVAAVYGPIARTGGDATMILRDLAVRLDGLSPSRSQGRPRDPGPARGSVHATINPGGWSVARIRRLARLRPEHLHPLGSGTGGDAPAATDTDPGQRHPRLRRPGPGHRRERLEPARSTRWATGRRCRTRRSTDHGPDGRLDIYLSNLGPQFLYGYCTSDDPGLDTPTHFTGVRLLRGRQQLHGADLPEPHPASEPEGDARPRVLPRRAVRVRHRRGHAG